MDFLAYLSNARTTEFLQCLSYAECYGKNAVREYFDRVCREWIINPYTFSGFLICLDNKAWEFSERGKGELSKFYADLFHEGEEKAVSRWKNEGDNGKEKIEIMYSIIDCGE